MMHANLKTPKQDYHLLRTRSLPGSSIIHTPAFVQHPCPSRSYMLAIPDRPIMPPPKCQFRDEEGNGLYAQSKAAQAMQTVAKVYPVLCRPDAMQEQRRLKRKSRLRKVIYTMRSYVLSVENSQREGVDATYSFNVLTSSPLLDAVECGEHQCAAHSPHHRHRNFHSAWPFDLSSELHDPARARCGGVVADEGGARGAKGETGGNTEHVCDVVSWRVFERVEGRLKCGKCVDCEEASRGLTDVVLRRVTMCMV
jgi:hypothetical protein